MSFDRVINVINFFPGASPERDAYLNDVTKSILMDHRGHFYLAN
jgi:hypothetical protein